MSLERLKSPISVTLSYFFLKKDLVMLWCNFDSETKNTSSSFITSSTKANLFLNEFMFKWPIIVLVALSNLCFFILMMSLEEPLSPITKGELSLALSSCSCQSKLVRDALEFLISTERALPNCVPSHSQPLSPTPTHFSRKTTHCHPFFDKNDPLPPIFQEKQPTPTHFSRKATHSHPFFDKNNTLLLIFRH